MRLVCPNCEAKYEVPDDAIPDTGRDVQCTNCGHTWYQMRGRTGAAPLTATPAAAPVSAVPADQGNPSLPVQDSAPVAAAVTPDEAPTPGVEPARDEEAKAGADDEGEPAVLEAAPAAGEAIADDMASEATIPGATDAAEDGPASEVAVAEDEGTAEAEIEPGVDAAPLATAEADAVSEAGPVAPAEDPVVATVPDDRSGSDLAAADTGSDSGAADGVDAPEAAAAEVGDDSPAPAGPDYAVDESVLAILREEAEREANARRAEALESQTDLGIDSAVPQKAVPLAAEAEAKPAARRDLLPDVEEINSTLRPSEVQEGADATPDFAPAPPQAPRGFRSGFLTLMTIAILAAALYIVAPRLAILVPGLAGPLESYVSMIDGLRLGLDGMMRSATVAISDG